MKMWLNVGKKLRVLILEYKDEDVYNMDESGFYYHLKPDKIISRGPVKGCKKGKNCIPLVFSINAGRSDKRTLIMIRK